MNAVSPLDNISELKKAVIWMQKTLTAYEDGLADSKEISTLAKRAQSKIESYIPKDHEKELKETALDLCVSLTTIERAQGNFESFYLSSLNNELEELSKTLGD